MLVVAFALSAGIASAVPNGLTKSFADGCFPIIGALRGMGKWRRHIYEGVGNSLGINLKTPWKKLSKEH